MKKYFVIVLALLIQGSACFSQDNSLKGLSTNDFKKNNIIVFLEVGDSNQNGAATISSASELDAIYSPIRQNVKIYYKPDRTLTDNGAWENYNPLPVGPGWNRSPGYARSTGYPTGVGPDIGFVYRLSQLLNRDVAILKMGRGGSGLLVTTADNAWDKSRNDLYNIFVNGFANPGLGRLKSILGYNNPVLGGVIVRLGTNDVSSTLWNQSAFTTAVTNLVNNLRNDLGSPNLPIYWVQLDSRISQTTGITIPAANVTAAQGVLTSASTSITNFTVIGPYTEDAIQSDFLHYLLGGYIRQGVYEADVVTATVN